MTADVLAPLAADWGALIDRYDATLCRTVGALIDAHAESLAERFYQHMGDDSHAGQFLAHQRVEEHLKPSMRRWLQEMFALRNRSDVPELIELQKRIGEIHARVDIPISLVMRGARFLKAAIFLQLGSARLGRAQLDAITFVSENIDIALEVMSQAYSLAHQRNARSEEAYRMFSVSQNIGTERERQRAGLLDWENQLMYDIALGAQAGQLQPLLQSDFGLWFKHKATHAFQDAVEMSAIREHVDRIERCIAHFQPAEGKLRQLRELRESTRVVRYLLDTLFARAGELEVGRDSLTQMLNRKFLSVVLNREIALARTTHSPFAVLMVDIDHFKSVNDNLGHEAGDLVLQQVAAILSQLHTRRRLRLPLRRRGIPADPRRHHRSHRHDTRRAGAPASRRGSLPARGEPLDPHHRQPRRGPARRSSGLPAHPAPRRPGALPGEERRPRPGGAGLRLNVIAPRAS
ncbi:diguanylate cyclase [Pseudomonas kuykendallii]|uniref:Diguanylate cyclase DosC n=1 Tax=Pseudomonas kuykendallii TaxID=1007099 RepID=A0A1H2WE92_9PSED|nr:diguanylate cyclase [Pseudomonas kuykendallii]